MKKMQGLREVFTVTERKDGAVYRTKSVGYAWVTIDKVPYQIGDTIYASVSTNEKRQTIRTVDESIPDIVETE